MNKISIKKLHDTFLYKDGHLFYKKHYSSKYNGKIAGGLDSKGYLRVKFMGICLRVHRIIFAMKHGFWPNIIDHINGIKTDNRIENLRSVTNSQNLLNMKKHILGHPIGVSFDKRARKRQWIARAPTIYLNRKSNKQKFIGNYESKEAASKAVVRFCTDGTILNSKETKNPFWQPLLPEQPKR